MAKRFLKHRAEETACQMHVEGERVAGLSHDEVFALLANARRRRVLHYLRHTGGTATLSEMASSIAAWENDVPVERLSSGDRKCVYTSLQQTHLKKLDDAGVVEYDHDRGHVEATEVAEELELYLEVVPDSEFPWREYYLALGAVATALCIVAWGNVGPFALVSEAVVASLVAVSLALSAAVHVSREQSTGVETGAGTASAAADDRE